MADFLTTNGTSFHIEDIIMEARKKLTLVSPYLQLSKTFYERLKDCSNKGVTITIVYGKDELKPNEKKSLSELKNLDLFYFENLHAKCYFNESKMVITSMNMYEFSEKNNREMGVLVDATVDESLYEKAFKEAQSIIDSSDEIILDERSKFSKEESNKGRKSYCKKTSLGYCIRCSKRIEFNNDRPLCHDCFKSWVFFENLDFKEKVCHGCGKYEHSSMRRPLCNSCWQSEGKSVKHYGTM